MASGRIPRSILATSLVTCSLAACASTGGSTSTAATPSGAASAHAASASASVQSGELLSRDRYANYEACTYSFEHGLRDDPGQALARNDWDLQFGNGGDLFSVSMTADDRSRLVDLGAFTWEALDRAGIPVTEPHAQPRRDPSLPVVVGHVYLVRTCDRDSDLTALLRVESLTPGDTVSFTWRVVQPTPAAGE